MYIITDKTRELVYKELMLDGNTEKELDNMSEQEQKNLLGADDDDKDFFEFDDKNYGIIETRGYSQGDVAQIFYSKKELAEVWGRKPNEKELETRFHNLFWDFPLCFRAIVNGKEYNGDEFLTSEYLSEDDAEEEILNHFRKSLKENVFNDFKELFESLSVRY